MPGEVPAGVRQMCGVTAGLGGGEGEGAGRVAGSMMGQAELVAASSAAGRARKGSISLDCGRIPRRRRVMMLGSETGRGRASFILVAWWAGNR